MVRLEMRYRRVRPPRSAARAAGAVAVAAMLALTAPVAAAAPARGGAAGRDAFAPVALPAYAPAGAHLPFAGAEHAACSAPSVGRAACLADVLVPASGASPNAYFGPPEVRTPTGLPPRTIEAAYGYSTSLEAGAGETVAVVDAYDDPAATANLETFSRQYGLPAASLTKVNQTGGSSPPASEPGWDLEISLDIQWVHAIAPAARILLVEASSNSIADLLVAERYASEHAAYVSNSWGATEFAGESSGDASFTHPGVSYFAASGDERSIVWWPSASPDVTSVGGTTITFTAAGTIASETAWGKGGGGCSSYESANPAQRTGSANCSGRRATPDVALDGDPSSGVSVYDGIAYGGYTGWRTVGGTSAATAMWAAEAAAGADVIDPSGMIGAPLIYAQPARLPLRDITSGSNGHPALAGYDLATGLGAWSNTPGAPGALTATGEIGRVKLTWSAPTGAPAREYAIWRGGYSSRETTLVARVPSSQTSYVDATVAERTTYYYEVGALNGAGSGPFSSQAWATAARRPSQR